MKKIIAFGASNSKQSINKAFATYAASQLKDVKTEIIDLNDYEMPIFSVDRELASGFPKLAQDFKQKIRECDGIIISFAEHNSAYTTAFKNIFDWISRIEKDVWLNKPMLLLATAPGARGGMSVLEIAYNRFSRGNENIVGTFSLPYFQEYFHDEFGIKDQELSKNFNNLLKAFDELVKGKA